MSVTQQWQWIAAAALVVAALAFAICFGLGWYSRRREEPMIYCSFCDKSQMEVKHLISGADVYICEGCISLCNEILAEKSMGQPTPPEPKPLQGTWDDRTGYETKTLVGR